jgi:hypothetical protein
MAQAMLEVHKQPEGAKAMVPWTKPLAECFKELPKKVLFLETNPPQVICCYTGLPLNQFCKMPLKAPKFTQLGAFRDLNCACSWLAIRREEGRLSQEECDHHLQNIYRFVGRPIGFAPDARQLAVKGGVQDFDSFQQMYEATRCTTGVKQVKEPVKKVKAKKDKKAAAEKTRAKFDHYLILKRTDTVTGIQEESPSAIPGIPCSSVQELLARFGEGYFAYDPATKAIVARQGSFAAPKQVAKLLKQGMGVELPSHTQSHRPETAVLLPAGHVRRFQKEKERIATAAAKLKRAKEKEKEKEKAKKPKKKKAKSNTAAVQSA